MERVTLTCDTSSLSLVNRYVFMYESRLVQNSSLNTLVIAQARIDHHDGRYTCVAYIDTVASNTSDVLTLNCESFVHFVIYMLNIVILY